MRGSTVVRRTVGFARDFPFVAETTVVGRAGVPVTATEFGHSPSGAAQRSQMAARDRAVSSVFRTDDHAADYQPAFRSGNHRAPFAPGFA